MNENNFRKFLEEIKRECSLCDDCGTCIYERFCFEVENKFPQSWKIEEIIKNKIG